MKVLVIAHGALRRSAWDALLSTQPGFSVIGTVPWAQDLATVVPSDAPEVVLADGDGADARRAVELVLAARGTGVLWLLDQLDLPTVVGLLRAGVIGCLTVESSAAELARALVAVGRGEIALPASVAAPALAALARPIAADPPDVDELTAREHDVIALLVRGPTNKDIAQTMFLSVRTVEAHLRSIYEKLGVRSRTEAVLWAIARQEHGR
jgi:DNA-binding NarL/FixJ family response regulator